MPPPHLRDADGQAAVELVALLPLLALILAVGWQAILAAHASWAVTAAAGAAARAAAVGSDPGAAARARLPARLERGLQVSARPPDAVEVSLRVPAVLAGLRLGRVSATGRFRSQEPVP